MLTAVKNILRKKKRVIYSQVLKKTFLEFTLLDIEREKRKGKYSRKVPRIPNTNIFPKIPISTG